MSASAPAALTSEPGWQAHLQLAFELAGRHTRLTRRAHRGPLLVQRPFYPESADSGNVPCHVYLVHPPGGVVSGDELTLETEVGAGAHALLTTPAAGKFYRRGEARFAQLTQRLRAQGTLEWLPQENIFFPHSAVRVRTRVELEHAARFIGWEISCLGLPVNAQSLGDGEVHQSFELWRGGTLRLLERQHLRGEALAARWGLGGQAVLGTWLASTPDAGALAAALLRARELAPVGEAAEVTLGCTLVDDVLICRALAARTDRLRAIFIELWQALRPMLLGRAATLPRIWAT